MEYKTKDLGEAAALVTEGIKLVALSWEENICWFEFSGADIKKISDMYWSGDLLVPARVYAGNLRSLKDRLFAQK